MIRYVVVGTCLTFLALISWSIPGLSQTLDDEVTERINNLGGTVSILSDCRSAIVSQPSTGFGFGPAIGPIPIIRIQNDGPASPGSSSSGGISIPISVPLLDMLSIRAINNTAQRNKGLSGQPNRLVAGKQSVFASEVFAPFVIVERKGLQRKESRYENSRDYVSRRISIGTTFISPLRTISGVSISGATGKGKLGDRGDYSDSNYGLAVFTTIRVSESGVGQLRGGFSQTDNERTRFATFSNEEVDCIGTPMAEFASDEIGVGLAYSQFIQLGRWALTLSASVDWKQTGIDTYTETYSQPNFDFDGNRGDELSGLELTFYEDKRDSLQSVASVGLGRSLVHGRWTIQPALLLQWMHEHAADQQELEASLVLDPEQRRFEYLRDALDRDYFVIDANATFGKDNISWLLGYRTVVGYDRLSVEAVTMGLSAAFD